MNTWAWKGQKKKEVLSYRRSVLSCCLLTQDRETCNRGLSQGSLSISLIAEYTTHSSIVFCLIRASERVFPRSWRKNPNERQLAVNKSYLALGLGRCLRVVLFPRRIQNENSASNLFRVIGSA